MTTTSIAIQLRQRRLASFCSYVNSFSRPVRILDVGGVPDFWRDAKWRMPPEILCLNIQPHRANEVAAAIAGDACDLSRWPDQSWEIVFSNSCIGHVGGWRHQAKMAAEIRRVGVTYWVQTPSHSFPFDWRTLTPGFHWLGLRLQAEILSRVSVGRYPKAASYAEAMSLLDQVRNLTAREMLALFPEATLARERVFGITKSFTAIKQPCQMA